MEINRNVSHSRGNKSSRGSKATSTDKTSTGSAISEPVFVNHAEIDWRQRREEWVGDQSQKPERTPREQIMSWTTTYEDLLLTTEPFQQPIPLAEMVDFLVDIWHEEGLFD